jgi:hypothetical protein
MVPMGERFARWLTVRYGHQGRPKARWAYWVERRLLHLRWSPNGRHVFLGEPPAVPPGMHDADG